MALVTHQVQGSYAIFPSRSVSWKRGMESKQFLATRPTVERTYRLCSFRRKCCLRVGAPLIQGSKGKELRILSFKGSGQNDESGDRASGSNHLKNSVKLSYVSRESEETLTASPKVQNAQVSSTSEAANTRAASLAIHKSWLTFLRTPAPNQLPDETLEGSSSKEILETQNGTHNNERDEALKAVWCYSLGLDATMKIPLMILIPMYLAVNIIYGAEVSKELNPLWIFGPLIVALYIKMLRGICSLCVFSFKQTVKVVKGLPSYYVVAYNYIARPKQWDYEGWLAEKQVDFLESIWPRYCRTMRLLKRAHFI